MEGAEEVLPQDPQGHGHGQAVHGGTHAGAKLNPKLFLQLYENLTDSYKEKKTVIDEILFIFCRRK